METGLLSLIYHLIELVNGNNNLFKLFYGVNMSRFKCYFDEELLTYYLNFESVNNKFQSFFKLNLPDGFDYTPVQAGEHRHEADEKQVREGHPAEEYRKVKLARNRLEFAGEQPDDARHRQHRQPRKGEQYPDKDRQYIIGELRRLILTILASKPPRIHRHESDRKGAFGKQPTEGVGQGEGQLVRVPCQPGAEHTGEQDVADKAEYAADDGETSDGRCVPKQAHRWFNLIGKYQASPAGCASAVACA